MHAPHLSPRALPRRRALALWQALPLLAALMAGSLATDAQAQWMWRDKDGQVNASDRPPPRDIADKDILARPGPDTRNAAAPRAADAASGALPPPPGLVTTPLDRELATRKRAAEQEQAAKTRAEEAKLAEQRAENCRSARGHMSALETGQRIARVNAQGEREILDDRARAEDMRRARDIIASDCR